MSFSYKVFGLRLESDRKIEGLDSVTAPGNIDVRIRFGAWPFERVVAEDLGHAPFYTSPVRDAAGRPFVLAWNVAGGSHLRLVMNGSTSITLDRQGREVWIDADAHHAPLVSDYILGFVLGLVLRRRGIVCLHASAVVIEGVAVAFTGPEGAGKSTLATLLAMQGHPVVTDDLAALLDDGVALFVQPGARYLRSRPGLIERHASDLGCLNRLKNAPDGWHVDYVATESERPRPSMLRLGAVYHLDGPTTEAPGQPDLERMNSADAFVSLCADTWGSRLLGPDERAREFDVVARLVNSVRLRRVARARACDLPALADRIRDDVRQQAIPAALHAH